MAELPQIFRWHISWRSRSAERRLHFVSVERRRNCQNVDLLRSAERRLNVFWTWVDTHLPVKRVMTRTDAVYSLLTKSTDSFNRPFRGRSPSSSLLNRKPWRRALPTFILSLSTERERPWSHRYSHHPSARSKSKDGQLPPIIQKRLSRSNSRMRSLRSRWASGL